MDTKTILTKTLDAVRKDYRNHLINSERCLQACLYKYLSQFLNGEDYKVFVEPKIDSGDKFNGKTPDIVVTKSRKITQVWEIKFRPQACPEAFFDLEKLDNLHKNWGVFQTPISLRLNGQWEEPSYKLTETTEYIFIVFGREGLAVSYEKIKVKHPEFKDLMESKHFYHLAAIVEDNETETNPTCKINGEIF